MDFKRNLTPRDFFKAFTNTMLIGYSELTPEVRYAQARWAQRCRNFFFTASCPVPAALPVGDFWPEKLIGMTERFTDPVIVTDMLTMVDRGSAPVDALSALLQIFDVGGIRGAYGDDWLGLSGPVRQEFIVKHEKNAGTAGVIPDRPAKWLGFVPRLLRPSETLRVEYSQVPADYPQLQLGFRALRVLKPDNPYQYLSTDAERRLRDYTETAQPETFFMDVVVPMATVRNATNAANPIVLRTREQGRPLLVLGAVSNVEGVQGKLFDESKQYRFDAPDLPLASTGQSGVNFGINLYRAVPLNLWAPNSEMHNPEMVNMFPVPHFLAPGSVLRVELTDGLAPSNLGVMTQRTLTRGEQDVRITFVCRTV